MKRIFLAVAACAMLILPVLIASASAEGPLGTVLLTQKGADARSTFVDNPPRKKESAGDVFTVAGPVRDAAGAPSGRVSGVFTQTSGTTAQGSVTFSLPQGDVVAVGAFAGRDPVDTLVIAGGTGAYVGAEGTVRFTEAKTRTEFLITFAG